MIQFGSSTVTVFGTLPEQTFVVSEERCTFSLRLVFQDRISLMPQFFGRDRNSHFHMVHFPFGPSPAVHPDAAVLQPFFILQLVDSCQNGIQTYTMSSMWIGKVTGYKHLIRFHIRQQLLHDGNIRFAQVVLLHQPCFIERQVEEVDMIVTLDPAVTGTCTGFFPADRAFHKEDITFFSFTFHLFITEEMDDFFGFLLNRFVFRIFGTNVAQIFAIADYLFIPYGNIAGSFVSDMYIMMLFAQTMECTAHRDDIVIRMRTEDNHFLRIRSCTFGTV